MNWDHRKQHNWEISDKEAWERDCDWNFEMGLKNVDICDPHECLQITPTTAEVAFGNQVDEVTCSFFP